MIKCESCGKEWDGALLVEREGLRHFYAPHSHRRIVEPGGHVWDVTFNEQPVIESLHQCRSCPILVSGASGDA